MTYNSRSARKIMLLTISPTALIWAGPVRAATDDSPQEQLDSSDPQAETSTRGQASSTASTSAAETPSGEIGDIVVTAQRREERGQSVPISLQSFSSETLESSGVSSTEDLSTIVGGLLIVPTSTRPSVYVRGVGTNSSNTTPAVLTFIDGVYMPFGNSLDLANIASLEVLKGPQGTLFGRNATGGVINITTTLPGANPDARAEFGYGNYDTLEANLYLGGGLADGVAADVAVGYTNQGKGFGTNIYNGEDVFLTERLNLRSRLRVDLSDLTSLTFAGWYNRVSGTIGNNVSPAFGYDTLFVEGVVQKRGTPFWPGDYDVNLGPRNPGYDANSGGGAVTLETDLSGMLFRSITSYQEGNELAIIDFDGGPNSLTNLIIDRNLRNAFTQELQLISDTDGPLEWVGGVFYYRAKNGLLPFSINDTIRAFGIDTDESIAPYGQATYSISPDTRVTLGGRFTWETRGIEGRVSIAGVDVPGRTGELEQSFAEFTWRAAIDHKVTPTVMAYASVSRGFNAGFYNQQGTAGFANETQNPPVLPEFLTAYEVGTKMDLLGRRLRVNLSGFYYDYTGLQQQIYDLTRGATLTINAAEAEIKGVEFEIVAKPFNSLTASLAGTFLDGTYGSYPLAPNYVRQPNGSIIAQGSVDAVGNKITNTPEWSYTATLSHVLSSAVGDFTTTASLNYRGDAFVDPGNRFALPTRYVMNLTERWTSSDERFFASIWVRNLFDEQYDYGINILPPLGLVGNPAPPRTYGLTVGFSL